MRATKALARLLLVSLILVSGMGCSGVAQPSIEPRVQNETYVFTDSAGREVEIPRDVSRIAPSGPLAQIVLYTLCPDKLVGNATEITEPQRWYIDEKYHSLPVFGSFYGDTLNLESLMVAAPQVIIDIGEPKGTIVEDMDGIQERTGIPSLFVEMNMDTMSAAYETLGRVTGEEEQAQKLMQYIDRTLSETKQKVAAIPHEDRVTVYYGQDEGLTALVKGTVHADVIEIAGGLNVADVEETVRGGASDISMEQLMLWNPDVILFSPGSVYDSVRDRPEWEEIAAVRNRRYVEVPVGPYNWMGRPPSVNRILGIRWLANLLYPDVFSYDMVQETKEFYDLFYHVHLTEDQAGVLLSKSTFSPAN